MVYAAFDLLAADGGCIYSIVHYPKAKVPLVKKFLENFLIKQTYAGCITELDHTKEAPG